MEERLAQIMAEMDFLRQKVAAQEIQINQLKAVQSPVANVANIIAGQKTSRRRMITRMATALIGLAALGSATLPTPTKIVYAAQSKPQAKTVEDGKPYLAPAPPLNTKPNPKERTVRPTNTGDSVIIGQTNGASTVDDATSIFHLTGTELSKKIFRAANYTNSDVTITYASDYRIGILAGVSGTDGGAFPRIGVVGLSDIGTGVKGDSSDGVGVWGNSFNDRGLYGYNMAGSYGAELRGGKAAIFLRYGDTDIPTEDIVEHTNGELVKASSDFSLWYCVESGAPGKWRKLAGTDTVGSLHMLPVSDRFGDTRTGLGGVNGRIVPGDSYTLTVAGTPGRDGKMIPLKANTIVGNVTVINPIGAGYVRVLPFGTPVGQGTSTVNYNDNFTTANAFQCPIVNGKIQVSVFSSTSIHLAIDISGYYL